MSTKALLAIGILFALATACGDSKSDASPTPTSSSEADEVRAAEQTVGFTVLVPQYVPNNLPQLSKVDAQTPQPRSPGGPFLGPYAATVALLYFSDDKDKDGLPLQTLIITEDKLTCHPCITSAADIHQIETSLGPATEDESLGDTYIRKTLSVATSDSNVSVELSWITAGAPTGDDIKAVHDEALKILESLTPVGH